MKLVVKYTSIEVHDYELGDCVSLERYFTLYDKIRHQTYLSGVVYDEENKILRLPRGVDIYFIEKLLDEKAHIESKSDEYDKGILSNIKIKFLPRDDDQKKAIQFMTGQGEYYKFKSSSSMLLSLGTGKGKTYCSIVASVIRGYRTMIITSSIQWLSQWKDCILDYCDNVNKKEIYTISGAHTIYRIMNKPEIVDRYKFFLVSDSTIRSYGDKHGWDQVSEFFKILKIGTKIYDECHLHFDVMCKIDFYSNTNMTYYLTATPLRSDKDENNIFQLYFKNIPNLELFDPEEDPHTHYISLKYNSRPNAMERGECASMKYGLDRNRYIQYVVKKDNFYKILKYVLHIIKGKKALIYIGINDAILTVRDWIIDNYPELEDEIGVYTSIIKNGKDKQAQLDKNIILSTTKSTGAAVDIAGLKYVVVLAEPFKSEVIVRQTLGRTRDPDTYYIEVVDMAFQQIVKYYKFKLPILKKYALSRKEINVSQDDLDRV